MNSFDEFLEAMGQDEIAELHASGGESVVDGDNILPSDGKEDIDEDFLEELGLLSDEDEETEEESESEVEDEEEVEGDFDYVMEDWNSDIILPDGSRLSANTLKNYNEINDRINEFEVTAKEVREREALLAQNTDMGVAALAHIEQTLNSIASQRPLNVVEQAQYQTLQQMKHYFSNTTEAFANTHARKNEASKRASETQFQANLDICFTKYPNLEQDIPIIKEYLEEKGVPANNYLNSVKMDPKVIEILQDAVAFRKVKNKVVKPTAKVSRRAVKGMNTTGKDVKTMEQNPFINSYDSASYDQFSRLGLFN